MATKMHDLVNQIESNASSDARSRAILEALHRLLSAIVENDPRSGQIALHKIGAYMLEPEPLDNPVGDVAPGKHAPGGAGSAGGTKASVITSCPNCKQQLTITHP